MVAIKQQMNKGEDILDENTHRGHIQEKIDAGTGTADEMAAWGEEVAAIDAEVDELLAR